MSQSQLKKTCFDASELPSPIEEAMESSGKLQKRNFVSLIDDAHSSF